MSNTVYKVQQASGILLNANENPYPIEDHILAEIKDSLDTVAFHRYPDDCAQSLRKAYSAYLNVQEENVIVGNGSDEMIGLIISIHITNGKKVYTLSPDFSMYDYYTGMHQGTMVKYPYGMDTDFDAANFIAYGKAQNVDIILFSNPNNPTGKMIPVKEIAEILKAFPHIPVVIDEAYGEFADESCISLINTYQNLIVLRTMSKAFGMAGIRCGCMVACASAMERIRPYKVPYNVNSLTQRIATVLLAHSEEKQAQIQTIKRERERMYQAIFRYTGERFKLYPSQANYLYGCTSDKEALFQALAKKQIVIRNYENSDYFRISIGTPEENDLVIAAIAEVFAAKERK